MESRPRIWVVFATYVVAVVAIVAASILAVPVLRSIEPDLSDSEVLRGLRGLLVGGIASSTALILTLLVATRGLSASRIRLVPGRETGRQLVVMVVGVLSLGQALDSLTVVAGLAHRGAMELIRQALAGASGPDLFLAVVVIGVLAGSAEELFFRAYMQSLLRERWRPSIAAVVTSACFGVLHFDWIHTPLAFILGLYLAFITELAGSALPAVACHIVNNATFTILTATLGSIPGFRTNVILLGAMAIVFTGCAVWLSDSMQPASG